MLLVPLDEKHWRPERVSNWSQHREEGKYLVSHHRESKTKILRVSPGLSAQSHILPITGIYIFIEILSLF